jgi:hypothetical protein
MSLISKVISAVTPSSHGDAEDAIALLKADHDEVSGLLDDYETLADDEGASAVERRELSRQICAALVIHAMIEEEIFYPAAAQAGVEAGLLHEAEVEHASVKEMIAQLGAMQAEDELYDAKVKVLGEYVRHHVKEEEGEMFPACKSADMDLDALGAELKSRKEELQETLGA